MWASGASRTRRPHLVRSDRASRSGTRGNPQRKVYSEPGPRDRALMPLTYPFTRSYRLAYRHYLLSLTGYVKPEDEPEQLLKRRSSGPEPQSRNPARAGRNRIFTSPTVYAGHSEV